MDNTADDRLSRIERSNVILRRYVVALGALTVTLVLALAGASVALVRGGINVQGLRAREITVVDAHGVVRARLSGDLPDGVAHGGRVMKRGAKAAGLIIYDEEGLERGGYLTQYPGSNAMLTLDSKYRQAALFVIAPDELQAGALSLWTKGSAIELRSDEDGSRLSMTRNNIVESQSPPVSIGKASCEEMQGLEKQSPDQGVCRSRFTESACRTCLSR
jgi:hypothetical protein